MSFALKPIVRKSSEALAADSLRLFIISGKIAPGTRLTEIGLAKQLDVARATVRAALHQMMQEGLVQLIPYTGWSVMSLSSTDVRELYTLRALFEGLAAKLACRLLSEGDRNTLEAALENLRLACRDGAADEVAKADFELHMLIVELSRHKRLQDQYRIVSQQIRVYIAASDKLASNSEIIDQHEPIVASIISGNEDVARRVSERHNETEGVVLEKHLLSLEAANQNR